MKRVNLFVIVALLSQILVLTGCKKETYELTKKYSPIALYFDPLEYTSAFPYSQLYPLFANYPTDWDKCGLRNLPIMVKYDYIDQSYGEGNWSIYASFNNSGFILEKNNSVFSDLEHYEYDEENHIIAIRANQNFNGPYDFLPPEYGGYKCPDNKISNWELRSTNNVFRKGFGGVRAYYFEYFFGDLLTNLTPTVDFENNTNTMGPMRFDDEGKLIYMSAPMTLNRFVAKAQNYENQLASECTYEYLSNGLCSSKIETIYYTSYHNPSDTLECRNNYSYNGKGDLVKWEYSGAEYEQSNGNQYHFNHIKFEINFDYEYDNKGNWTKMIVIMPYNYQMIAELAKWYEQNKKNSPYQEPTGKYNSDTTFVIHRSIDGYYEKTAEQIKEQKAKEEEKILEKERKEIPQITAVQCYGLKGKVKSLKTDEKIINFNKIGNVESMKYLDSNFEIAYYYQTPFKYGFADGQYNYQIKIKDNIRIDEDPNDESTKEEFHFDNQGRLVEHHFVEYMAFMVYKYSYKDNDPNPVSLTYQWGDEQGEGDVEIEYTYLDFDKKGNWIRRKCRIHSTGTEYDESSDQNKTFENTEDQIESRKILYY